MGYCPVRTIVLCVETLKNLYSCLVFAQQLPFDHISDRAAQKWRDQLAFEVYADASREQQDKVILGQINRCRWWRPASHEYVELPPSPRREMATSVSSHEVTRVSRVRPSASSATLPAATIYTSPANLENAIAFQERLYRRAMQQRPQATSTETAMEWKVKRRHDGTRYIVRRPIENRRQRDTRPKCRRRHQERPRAENVGLLSVTIV
uniref:Uncharacterized protein n=1 Tax=Lutzomyia longipalpis TaxID=7200 RepID=A0A1B0CRB6_LUTLO